MRVVTYDDIQKINRLYYELKTYAAVARETGFAPTTVKKYVDKNYKPIEEDKIKRYEGKLPEFDSKVFRGKDWGEMCMLSNEEEDEVIKLWEEMEV